VAIARFLDRDAYQHTSCDCHVFRYWMFVGRCFLQDTVLTKYEAVANQSRAKKRKADSCKGRYPNSLPARESISRYLNTDRATISLAVVITQSIVYK